MTALPFPQTRRFASHCAHLSYVRAGNEGFFTCACDHYAADGFDVYKIQTLVPLCTALLSVEGFVG